MIYDKKNNGILKKGPIELILFQTSVLPMGWRECCQTMDEVSVCILRILLTVQSSLGKYRPALPVSLS